jgi:broad specificity phosphatase PhoE
MILYFIRHCQSEGNANEILASRMDFPLSAEGHKQAQSIAAAFYQNYTVDTIISSPLQRAGQTAGYFAGLYNIEAEYNDKLMEHDLGIFTGMSYGEIKTRDDYEHDRGSRWNWRPENGESYKDVYTRIEDFFKELYARDDNRTTLVVSHAVTMRMVQTFLTKSAPSYPLTIAGNGEIWRIDFQSCDLKHEIEILEAGADSRA